MFVGTLMILGEPYNPMELINNPDAESFNQWGRNILALFFPNSVYFQPYHMEYFGASIYTANIPLLGASGAVFGLLAGFGTLFPDNKIMLLIPPIPLKAKWFVLIYGAIELFLGLGNFNTGVAHFAHLGGAVVGFLLIMYWRKNRNNFNR